MYPARRIAAAALVLVACWLLLISQRGHPQVDAQELKSAADLKWYRGNLHTHSLWSDGDDFLESIAEWYQAHAYQFLVFTDHNILADRERWVAVDSVKSGRKAFEKLTKNSPSGWIDAREKDGKQEVRLKTFAEVAQRFNQPGKFLLVQGEEVSDKFEKYPIHLNATNVKELIQPRHGDSAAEVIQNNVDALIAQRERTKQPMMIHLNHPNFGFGVTAEDLMRVRGENFFEVYNGHPSVHNEGDAQHAGTERMWDIINSRRLTEFGLPLLYGLATDDGHSYHQIPSRNSEPGRGWVMVLAQELSAAALIDALERGRFYASSGVTLESVTTSSGSLDVVIQPQPETKYVIEFVGTKAGFQATHEPVLDANNKPIHATRRYSADVGEILARVEGTRATFKFQGQELFVRARITSDRKHPNPSEPGEFERAWTQPTLGPAGRTR